MKIDDTLASVQRLYVETAPFIYFIERNSTYVDRMREIFRQVNQRNLTVVTSTITLTETLTKPLNAGDKVLEKAYRDFLLRTRHVELTVISARIAEQAAQLRAQYKLKTPDALQVASAINSNADIFLTNDMGLKRVTEISIVTVDELDL